MSPREGSLPPLHLDPMAFPRDEDTEDSASAPWVSACQAGGQGSPSIPNAATDTWDDSAGDGAPQQTSQETCQGARPDTCCDPRPVGCEDSRHGSSPALKPPRHRRSGSECIPTLTSPSADFSPVPMQKSPSENSQPQHETPSESPNTSSCSGGCPRPASGRRNQGSHSRRPKTPDSSSSAGWVDPNALHMDLWASNSGRRHRMRKSNSEKDLLSLGQTCGKTLMRSQRGERLKTLLESMSTT